MRLPGPINQFAHNYINQLKWFFVIFFAVGIVGMLLPPTFPLFKRLIPFAILLSLCGVAIYHNKYNSNAISAFLIIYLFSFLAELLGVKTGIIFGEYEYGESLGIKVYNTPLIIGINWLLLIYATAAAVEKVKMHAGLKVLLASLMMVVYDIVVEKVAPKLDMWNWQENVVPLKNYLAWFVLALIFHSVLKIFKVKATNKIAAFILVCQFFFFILLFFTLTLK